MVRMLLALLLGAGLFVAGPLWADPGEHGMSGCGGGMHGMMDGHGMGMMDESGPGGCGCGDDGDMHMAGPGQGMRGGFGRFLMPDLNQDQRSRLNRVQQDLRRQHWNLKGRIMDEQAKLYDLYAADRPDPKKIGAVYGAIFDIRRQMAETTIDAMNRARDILTKEQQARLKQLQQPGMCGPDGHHPMSGSTGTR